MHECKWGYKDCKFLDDNAFYHCSGLISIDLPNCTAMAGGIFNYCSSLTTVKRICLNLCAIWKVN